MAKTTHEAILQRWSALLQELHAALSGEEPRPRSTPAILKNLHEILRDPDAKGLGLHRPCTWLPEWTAFSPNGADSELDRERRLDWVTKGWVPATAEDRRRAEARRKAQEAVQELDRLRAVQRREEEAIAVQQVITRRALSNVVGPTR